MSRPAIVPTRKLSQLAVHVADGLDSPSVHYSILENQAALCASSVQPAERELALEAINPAVELEPTLQSLHANHAYMEFLFGDRLKAHSIFQGIATSFTFPDIYRAPLALAYAKYQADPLSVDSAP